jgi:hypothetical protein
MSERMTPLQEKWYRQGFAACEQIVAGMELPFHLRHKIVTTCRSAERQRTQQTDLDAHHALLESRTAMQVQAAATESTVSENRAAARAVLVVHRGGRA